MCTPRPDWHSSSPPWRHNPHWGRDWDHKRRFIFWRFFAFLGAIAFFFLIAVIVVVYLAARPLGLAQVHWPGVFLAICAVPLGFFTLVTIFGGMAFRRIGTPLAEIMAAADAVAEGDLSARVKENSPGEMGRLAQSFNRMTAELERNEKQRRNLTADVAHELRTPLHVIQGNLEGIIDGVYEPSPEHITATLEETRLLSRLVNDLQTLSLAEAGQLPLHKTRFLIEDLLADVATSFAGSAAEAGVELRVEAIDPDPAEGQGTRLELNADPDRLNQVISNLVANALRYTPRGGQIFLRAQPQPGGVRLAVEDTGAGIPAEELPYVFDRFWRGDRSRSRGGGAGSGLGLAIARQLVQAHGGKIAVESRLGQGTIFSIDFNAEG